jgi:hypothetical protein
MYLRLNTIDRQYAQKIFLRIVLGKYPALRKHMIVLIKLIKQKKAPKSSLMNMILQYMGRHTANMALQISTSASVNYAIKRRILYNKYKHKRNEMCHACFSFCAQCTCPTCGKMCFCAGCIDYGSCMRCSVQ